MRNLLMDGGPATTHKERQYEDVENYVKVAEPDDLAENDMADLKTAWAESQQDEKKFKSVLARFV